MKRVGWLKFNIDATRPFTVKGILDLNHFPHLSEAIEVDERIATGVLCSPYGILRLHIRLTRRAFVPGEVVRVEGRIVNESDSRVKSSFVMLQEHTEFTSTKKTRLEVRGICGSEGPIVGARESGLWNGPLFRIPPLPPTKLASCNIINVQYCIVFEILMSGFFGKKLKLVVPITVGTIPFRATFQALRPR